jgi:hypothetical protein
MAPRIKITSFSMDYMYDQSYLYALFFLSHG